ncbi:MAG: hypothetical protein AB7E95_04910 [Kiritimatiellales bacterium]
MSQHILCFLEIIIGIIAMVSIQGGLILGGSKLAGIKRATYLSSISIALQCWGLSVIIGVISMPLANIMILWTILNMVACFLIPIVVIKNTYHIQPENAFWAAFGYFSMAAIALFGLMIFLNNA